VVEAGLSADWAEAQACIMDISTACSNYASLADLTPQAVYKQSTITSILPKANHAPML
jgi:hypothetical protein